MERADYKAGIGFGVGLLSSTLMLTQLVLTRIFSVVIWYHFAFFAISVALLGLGVGGVAAHLARERVRPKSVASLAAAGCLVLAVCIGLLDLALVHVVPDWFGSARPSVFTGLTGRLAALFLCCALPFAVGGFVLSLCMTRFAGHLHRIYRWDLIGAGVGCLAAIPLLSRLGGPLALMAVALWAIFAALAFARTGTGAGYAWLARGAALLFAAGALWGAHSGALSLKVAKGLDLTAHRPEYVRWNSFSMVSVFDEPFFRGWGVSSHFEAAPPPQKRILIDMNAMTPIVAAGAVPDGGYVTQDLSVLAYHLLAPERVCVIGAGGGKDVLAALRMGAKGVTAVEVNPLVVDALRGPYAEFSGHIYDRDDVRVVVGDGRGFARRSPERFDVVLLSMVDTSAATAAGAYTMTENGLYTVDALVDFMELLRPGGILSVATVSLEGLPVGARLASISAAAMRRRGDDPALSVYVVKTPWLSIPGALMYNFMLRPGGFADLDRRQGLLGFETAYAPGRSRPSADFEAHLIHAALRGDQRAVAASREDVSAVTDDRPFFFYQSRLSELPDALRSGGRSHLIGNGLDVLAKVLLIALIASALLLIMPLTLRRMRGASPVELFYVACLGLGFMFVEIGFLQRFSLYIGHPTHALAAVLFVLLVFAGVGSGWLVPRMASRSGAGMLPTLAVAALTGISCVSLSPLLGAASGLAVEGRAAITALWLAPLGLAAGVPLAAGLRVIGGRNPERIPWLWAVNSATGVLGSVAATLTALHFGITATLLVGASFYLLASVLWRMLRP